MPAKPRQRAIVQLIDILGKKWVLRILWELSNTPCTFRELQSRCGDLSPTIINTRIKDLCEAQLVYKSPETGYTLSPAGNELVTLFSPINEFAERWVKEKEG
jgi:DNA-binding HxlR family transcriptional regulator